MSGHPVGLDFQLSPIQFERLPVPLSPEFRRGDLLERVHIARFELQGLPEMRLPRLDLPRLLQGPTQEDMNGLSCGESPSEGRSILD